MSVEFWHRCWDLKERYGGPDVLIGGVGIPLFLIYSLDIISREFIKNSGKYISFVELITVRRINASLVYTPPIY